MAPPHAALTVPVAVAATVGHIAPFAVEDVSVGPRALVAGGAAVVVSASVAAVVLHAAGDFVGLAVVVVGGSAAALESPAAVVVVVVVVVENVDAACHLGSLVGSPLQKQEEEKRRRRSGPLQRHTTWELPQYFL